MDKKLINIVKGDINTAILNGSYNRNTAYQANIEFNTPTKLILLDGVPYSNPSLTKVTWLELKDLRDNNRLIAGSLYRITDYNCTTTQEKTRSAGHQFDIVLLALSEDKLAEEGWAMMHDNIYNVTFATGETIKCYISETYYVDDSPKMNLVSCDTYKGVRIAPTDITAIDNVLKTAKVTLPLFLVKTDDLTYNYFQNSNLSAWKVWYCLDNDKNRFAWADDADTLQIYDDEYNYVRYPQGDRIKNDGYNYCWDYDGQKVYTQSPNPMVGDTIDEGMGETPVTKVEGFGRGVIYRLIDEWNNDVPYDFKNVQFLTKYDQEGFFDNISNTQGYAYTFNTCDISSDDADASRFEDLSMISEREQIDDGGNYCYNNIIKPVFEGKDGIFPTVSVLPNNVFMNQYSSSIYQGVNNTFIEGKEHRISNNAGDIHIICSSNVKLNSCTMCGFYFCNGSSFTNKYHNIYVMDKKVLTET